MQLTVKHQAYGYVRQQIACEKTGQGGKGTNVAASGTSHVHRTSHVHQSPVNGSAKLHQQIHLLKLKQTAQEDELNTMAFHFQRLVQVVVMAAGVVWPAVSFINQSDFFNRFPS